MDVFSEIEIEALVEEADGLEQIEAQPTGGVAALKAQLEIVTTFLV